jgi:uncharacterized membrane protein
MPRKRHFLQSTFFTGLVLLAPLGITILIVQKIVGLVEASSPIGFWGGLGVALAVIFVVGLISRTALRSLGPAIDDFLHRIPGVGAIYGYTRDLMKAFAGQDKRFSHPVWVYPYPRSKMRLIGFITREDLRVLGLKGEVAVFIPLAYNISGTLVVLPRNQVKVVETKSKDLLAFVATGGLSGAHAPGSDRGD